MAKSKLNSRANLKEDYEYLISIHQAICKAIAQHNQVNVEPSVELHTRLGRMERIMQRHRNIIDFGVHDKEMVHLLKEGISSPTLPLS